jgi:4-diphosphocytidyl-2-C-methyl-D-erythritol kinase
MITVQAPAKVNLTLEVLGRRDDGYHEIRSVVQAVGLHDTLRLDWGRRVTFTCDLPGWDAGTSLVSQAVALLQQTMGHERGVAVDIEKRIPLMSGLGGDSSDAAAVLLGLDRLWGVHLPVERLHELAGRLGSDVAFFLQGGTALMRGRGENVTPLLSPPSMWAILMVPDVPREPGKTARAYAALDEQDFTDGHFTDDLAGVIDRCGDITPGLLHNVFDRTVLDGSEELDRCRRLMRDAGAAAVQLAGSGPALYALAGNQREAEGIAGDLRAQGLVACAASLGVSN